MIKYKDNIIKKLSDAGYSQYWLVKNHKISANSLLRIKNDEPISFETLNVICTLLNCQPEDVIYFEKEQSYAIYNQTSC